MRSSDGEGRSNALYPALSGEWEVPVRPTILDVPAQSLRAREAEWELGTFATDKYRSSLTTSRNHYAA